MASSPGPHYKRGAMTYTQKARLTFLLVPLLVILMFVVAYMSRVPQPVPEAFEYQGLAYVPSNIVTRLSDKDVYAVGTSSNGDVIYRVRGGGGGMGMPELLIKRSGQYVLLRHVTYPAATPYPTHSP